MYKYILCIITIIFSSGGFAEVCKYAEDGSNRNINFDITKSLKKSGNIEGATFQVTASSSVGVNAICPAGTKENYTMRSYVSPYPVVHTEGKFSYLKLNEYLQSAIRITDSAKGDYYPPVNYFKMGTTNAIENHTAFAVEDSNLRFNFIITKPFIGSVSYNMNPAFYVYVTTKNTDPLNEVVYTISYSGTITVPQNCEVNAGQVIAMDFGNIGASNFSQAGAGNKPSGVNPQTKVIGIKCKNADAQALLSLRLEANKVSGNAVVSDNKDLGFVVADGGKKPLTPNNIDSNIPFQLDDNASASVPITAWPVSVTGNKPIEGKFTAEGYLRVDFD